MHTADSRDRFAQELGDLLLAGLDLTAQVVPTRGGKCQLRITTSTGATGSATFDDECVRSSDTFHKLAGSPTAAQLRVANVTTAAHAPMIDEFVALLECGWTVSVTHQACPDDQRDAAITIDATPPPGESARRLAEAVRVDRVALRIVWDLIGVDDNGLVTEWGFASSETGLRVIDGIRASTTASVAAMTIAGAADWSLPDDLKAPPPRHSVGDPMPSSSIDELIGNLVVAQPAPAEIDDRRRRVVKWARSAGFDATVHPATKSRVATELVNLGRGTAGYYLLEFENGQCYVGQSVSIAKRLDQHRSVHRDIRQIHINPDPTASDQPLALSRHLLRRERELIHNAQNAKLVMRNRAEMSIIPRNGQLLDRELLPPELRREWISDPVGVNRRSMAGESVFGPDQRHAELYVDAVATMLERAGADATAVVECIRAYVTRCVPVPLLTEYEYWTLSTPRIRSRRSACRLSCLSIGFTEVLTLFADGERCSGFVQVSATELLGGPDDEPDAAIRFCRNHPGVEVTGATYKDAGPDNLLLRAPSIRALAQLLDDTTVTRAAATAALNLMRVRKSGTKRKESHNPYLAGMALDIQ